jgi:PAS domain S-box-containing protein
MVDTSGEFTNENSNEDIQEAKQKLRTAYDILESIGDYVSSFDSDWNFIYVNKVTANAFGFKPEDLIGKNVWKTFPKFVGTELEKNCLEALSKRESRCFEWNPIYANAGFMEFKVIPSAKGVTVYGVNITDRKKVQEELIQTQNEMTAILENIDNGFISLDNQWRFVYVNRFASSRVGIEAKDLIGKNFWEKFPQAIGTETEAYYRKAFKEKVSLHFENYGIITGRWYEQKVYPTSDGIAIFWIDITKRKKSEELLKQNEARLKAIILNSPIGIATTDSNKFILSANESFCRILGFSEDELRKLTFKDFTHPDDLNESISLMEDLSSGIVPFFSLEKRYIRKDGKIINGKITISTIRNNEGKPDLFIAELEDITERKKLEAQLKEYANNLEKLVEERTTHLIQSEQSYRELYESFDEAFIAIDWELNVIHWNKAAEGITLIKAENALGKKIYDILPETFTVNLEPYYKSLQEQKPIRFSMQTKNRKTGQDAVFELSTYPSKLGIIVIIEDITEQEQTRRLAIIGQTVGMIGHDIRNPLQAITNELFIAKQAIDDASEGEGKAETLDSLSLIQEQTDYISKIVSDLQDYARPLRPELVEVDVKSLITSALSTLNVPDNIEAFAYFDKKLPRLRTDPMLLKRVLLNLATNSIQAMPEGGKLTINAKEDENNNRITITVKDTGVGMPKEVQEKIFTPLFTTKAKGQGLGLAVVKRLVEALNGKISFESQEGKGTKFMIELHLSSEP